MVMPSIGGLGGGGGGSSMEIGGVTLENVTTARESGGMQAPSKKTEEGFSYASKVGPEPVKATFETYIEPTTYGQLADLRDADEPVSVTVGFVSLGACKVSDISVDQKASQISHYKVSIKVEEVQEATTGTATLSIDSSSGSSHSGSAATTDPTLVRSSQQSASNGDGGGGSAIGDVKSWLGF